MTSDFSGFMASSLCRNQDESDMSANSRLVRPGLDGSDESSMYSWVYCFSRPIILSVC